MKHWGKDLATILKAIVGCAIFALGFDLFLVPNDLNAGGLTGLSMVLVHLIGYGTIGIVSALMNLPLFILAGAKIGKRFFVYSLVGMLLSSLFIDIFSILPVPETEPLIGALYGGAISGLGLGIVFAGGASTGGSDIIVRLLKLRWRDVPIGTINICFDFIVAALTGIVFKDAARALYSGVAIFVVGQVIDAVVYRFDYSKVALIISPRYEEIAKKINDKLDRGVTYLDGKGYYLRTETQVILTAVKRQQLADLKELVVEIDPNAFIIVQEAHQVLGDGFTHYSKDSL